MCVCVSNCKELVYAIGVLAREGQAGTLWHELELLSTGRSFHLALQAFHLIKAGPPRVLKIISFT